MCLSLPNKLDSSENDHGYRIYGYGIVIILICGQYKAVC